MNNEQTNISKTAKYILEKKQTGKHFKKKQNAILRNRASKTEWTNFKKQMQFGENRTDKHFKKQTNVVLGKIKHFKQKQNAVFRNWASKNECTKISKRKQMQFEDSLR